MLPRTHFPRIHIPVLRAAIAFLMVAACPLPSQAQTRDILVFGPENMRAALHDANDLFLFENAMNVRMTYGPSSELAQRVENATPGDFFIAADPASMDRLAERKLIRPDTLENLLGNTLVLIAPADSRATLSVAPDFPLASALGGGQLAMPDPASAPAGKYAKAALEKLGVWSAVAGKVTAAKDESETLDLVSSGKAPFGIVYQADAASDKKVKVIAAFPEASHPPIVYSIAILESSTNVLASIYVQWLRSGKADEFLEKYGFTILH